MKYTMTHSVAMVGDELLGWVLLLLSASSYSGSPQRENVFH